MRTDLLREAWDALRAGEDADGGAGDCGFRPGDLIVTGEADVRPPRLPSRFRAEELAVACVGVALLAAASLHRARGGAEVQPGVDRDHVAAAVRSERYFRMPGQPPGPGFAPLSRFWEAGDGWVRTHANYPWHKAALLRALGAPDDADAVGAAIAGLAAEAVEERVFAAGGIAAAVRTAGQWRAHPQGRAVAQEPLIGHEALGPAEPTVAAAGPLPATGVRVLDLTRVIAGPVCTRFLGALGADVLRVDPPRHPDMPAGTAADSLLGKRSSALDLRDPGAVDALDGLSSRADVVVTGYRPGALDRFGLTPEQLAERRPGVVVVVLDAWGHTGPWADRRGFDSVVQAPTGIAAGEGPDGATPGALPCQLLDHGTGYLAAAAALDGLRRQAETGGTHVRRVSLARTAAWVVAAGPGEPTTTTVGPAPARAEGDERWRSSFAGEGIDAVAPPGSLGGNPLRWPGPPARYQTDDAAWSYRH